MTKNILRTLCAFYLFSFSILFFPLSASAAPINKMIVFGDSLSDIGNIYALTDKQIPIDPPYYRGRFSNGPLWVEYLANRLNIDVNSSTQFYGFAYAGAWAASGTPDDSHPLIDLDWEVGSYIIQSGIVNPPDDHSLIVLWIGNNDYLNGREHGDIDAVTSDAITAIERNITSLIQLGAKHFFIINVPNLGLTPSALNAGSAFANRVSLLADMHNQKLERLISSLKTKNPSVNFVTFDVAPYFTDLISHPEKYNIKETINACYEGDFGELKGIRTSPKITMLNNSLNYSQMHRHQGGIRITESCKNPDEYIFWDHVHPTATVHHLLANFASQALSERGIG